MMQQQLFGCDGCSKLIVVFSLEREMLLIKSGPVE